LSVFAVIGFLSKYLFIYLLLAIGLLFIYSIFIQKNKKFDFKYLIILEIFIVLLLPHIIWLSSNNYISITYGLARAGLENSSLLDHIFLPVIFLGKQVGILIPFFIMSFFLVTKFRFKISLKDKNLLFLIFINLVPIGLMFLTSMITGSKIRAMWMTPFYLFFGVLIVYIFQAHINLKKLNGFISVFLILFIFSPFTYAYISITEIDKRTDYPGKQIAMKTQYAWDQNHNEPINVVLGDEWYAGNLSYHLKSRPIWEGSITKDKLNLLSKFICIDNICIGNR
jgi:4-amino-4-deoxy-L-arabinose transferase-like glycosyltransferase